MKRDEDGDISGGDGDDGDDGCYGRFWRMMKCRCCGGENNYMTVVEVGKIGAEPYKNYLEVFTGEFTGWELGRSDNIKTRARHLTGLTSSNPPCLY